MVSLISEVLFTVPSAFISMTYTALLPSPLALSPIVPTARSGTPSPSRSPMDATDMPKKSLSAKTGPFGVWSLISMAAVGYTSSLTRAMPRPASPAPRATLSDKSDTAAHATYKQRRNVL